MFMSMLLLMPACTGSILGFLKALQTWCRVVVNVAHNASNFTLAHKHGNHHYTHGLLSKLSGTYLFTRQCKHSSCKKNFLFRQVDGYLKTIAHMHVSGDIVLIGMEENSLKGQSQVSNAHTYH